MFKIKRYARETLVPAYALCWLTWFMNFLMTGASDAMLFWVSFYSFIAIITANDFYDQMKSKLPTS